MSVVRRAVTAAVVLAALAAVTPSALAAPQGPTHLVLSVSTPTRAIAPTPRSVTLSCDPVGGLHPNADEACSELDAADGGFGQLAPTRQLCPMIYNPVTATATATGIWRGQPVNWSEEFANSCVMSQRTGAVFRF